MKYPMYSVRDKVTSFMPPICEINENSAIRNFAQAINNGNLQYQSEDFDLYRVGSFDDVSGEIETILPEFVVNGLQVRKEK